MTCGRENTETEEGLVERACVGVLFDNLRLLGRLKPDLGHLCVEHLRLGLLETALVIIPSTALNIQAIDVGTIFSCLFRFKVIFLDIVVPLNQIDSNGVLPGEVLFETCEEGLGEEETREPECGRAAFVDPLFHEDKTINHVHNVGGEWLQGWVGYFGPRGRDLVVNQRTSNFFKLGTHHDLALDGKLDILQ